MDRDEVMYLYVILYVIYMIGQQFFSLMITFAVTGHLYSSEESGDCFINT